MSVALREAGFREELGGEFTPPATHYRLGEADQGFYVEFLAPRPGSGFKRGGKRDATMAKAGVTAQKLRYVDLLLIHPWELMLDGRHDLPVTRPVTVLLANPVSFIVQKLLIQKDREVHKQAQGVLYIHDTLELFPVADLKAEWHDHVRPMLAPSTPTELDRIRTAKFGTVTDVIRAAARIPQDRLLRPDTMKATCAYGLERIFGSE